MKTKKAFPWLEFHKDTHRTLSEPLINRAIFYFPLEFVNRGISAYGGLVTGYIYRSGNTRVSQRVALKKKGSPV